MRHETIAKGTNVMKDKQHYKALAKKLSRYENGNGMAQTARKCKEHKKTKSQETKEAITADLNLNGQNIVLWRVRKFNHLKNGGPKSTHRKHDWPKRCWKPLWDNAPSAAYL